MSYSYVGKAIRKKDSMQLLLGKPVYVNDVAPNDALIVKVLRSPHANAIIKNIDIKTALSVDGIECIFTHEDVHSERFTMAGQTFPELSPYDRLLLDPHVRFVGDAVAILAGETEKAVLKAMELIEVEYEVLTPVLDMDTAKDNETLVHPEENWKSLFPVGADNKRNLCATGGNSDGDVNEIFKTCDIVFEREFHTQACNQVPMEPFVAYSEIDAYGRIHVTAATQIVFHARRIIANALGIPKNKVRVSKTRIGGGFGAKQTVIAEVYPAFVTFKTGKKAKMVYTRKEALIASSPRHEMKVKVKLGGMKDGSISALEVYTLSNTGAYGEHGPTTVGLSGSKSIPMYSRSLKAYNFSFDVVYTNIQSSGAYRGYGATQGIFAIESMVNEFASMIDMDAVAIREKNMVREGDFMPAYDREFLEASSLDRCITKAKEMFNWDEKSQVRDMGNGKVRSSGVAVAMQGSGIAFVDVGSATIKLGEDGGYELIIGAADMGTGCDTILSQIAAECLECDVDKISVFGADTDSSPYDSGSYASSTTYLTGKALEKACIKLRKNLCEIASNMLECDETELNFLGDRIAKADNSAEVSLVDISNKAMCGNVISTQFTESHSSTTSPPPLMVGMVEIELDKRTGSVELLDYVAVVDCGTAINPNLVKVQTEGGIVQGIGMALSESITYSSKGNLVEDSLMTYKVPTRLDISRLRVDIEGSFAQSGPFGAKSVGEIVINTPCPAIAHAVFNATGQWHRELPMTPEKIWTKMVDKA